MSQLIVPNPLIREIYDSGKVYDLENNEHKVWAHISAEHCNALYKHVLATKPGRIVEIGMSCGLSTLGMLTALHEIGNGCMISIDPFQSTERKSIGVANVRRAGFANRHTLMEAKDYIALPQLLERGDKFDFAYIDGWHTFDYTLLDFFYIDKMLNVGGVVAFNDCGWKAVHRVLRFVSTHRKYKEIDVGLTRDYSGRNILFTMLRRAADFARQDRYYQKLEDWEPHSHFYKRF